MLYAKGKASDHGSNVTGLLAATLGDGGMAGLLSAISTTQSHGGFDIDVSYDNFSSNMLAKITTLTDNGYKLFNLSSGTHRCEREYFSCVSNGRQSNGDPIPTESGTEEASHFDDEKKEFEKLIRYVEKEHPDVILVVSAGNGNTDAGAETRLYSSIKSDQIIVVGAHDSIKGTQRDYFPSSLNFYTNYGERVDISAAGTIRAAIPNRYPKTRKKWDNDCADRFGKDTRAFNYCLSQYETETSGTLGTSFATPLVTATIAMMRSIEPSLTPTEVLEILRTTALKIKDNEVKLIGEARKGCSSTVFVRPLVEEKDENGCFKFDNSESNQGLRLNIEGAIIATIAHRINKILQENGDAGDSFSNEAYRIGDRIEILSSAPLTIVYDNYRKVIGFQRNNAKGTVIAKGVGSNKAWLNIKFDQGISDGWVNSHLVNLVERTQASLVGDVSFEDNQLKQCVLDAASSANWQTIEQVTNLNCNGSSISDLTGIQEFTSLQTLDLSNNQLTSINGLDSLTQLTSLNLSGNNISCDAIETLQQALPNTTIIRPTGCTPVVVQTNFGWPVKDPTFTQGFAAYGEVAAGKYHTGFDLISDSGDLNVYAAAGKVRVLPDGTLNNHNHLMGNTIVIDHNDGKGPFTVYSHLASIDVTNGATVNAGQKIGVMGKTGCEHGNPPCGVHLHFEVRAWDAIGNLDDDLGPVWGYSTTHPNLTGYINPYPYLDHGWQAYSSKVIRATTNQPIKTGPGNEYTQSLGNVMQDQRFVATQQVGNWYEIDFPSEYGPAKGWIQGELVPENSTSLRKVTDPARGIIGVSVCNSPSACSNTANRLSYVWDAQHIVELDQAVAGNGCTKSWVKTSLPNNQTGWVCGDYLDNPNNGTPVVVANSQICGTDYNAFVNKYGANRNFNPNLYAFAALKADGSITAWGSSTYGGNGAPTDNGYISITSNGYAFAALKADGSITAWGESASGGSGAPADSGYVSISGVGPNTPDNCSPFPITLIPQAVW